jgi:hypothetical protein
MGKILPLLFLKEQIMLSGTEKQLLFFFEENERIAFFFERIAF